MLGDVADNANVDWKNKFELTSGLSAEKLNGNSAKQLLVAVLFMKPEKDNLKDEIKHRLLLLEESMESAKDDELLHLLFCDEHSKHTEFLSLIELFENRLGFEHFEVSRYTPILDSNTKEPLKIGDFVENYNKQCGTLSFCEVFNKYVMKTETGGQISITSYVIKTPKLYDYKIDNTSVECRPNPHKKRW